MANQSPNNRNTSSNGSKNTKMRHGGNVTSMIVVVVGVLVILLIVWFLANTIIDMTGGSSTGVGVTTGTSASQSAEDAASNDGTATDANAETSADTSNGEAAASTAESEEQASSIEVIPGEAVLSDPATWLGKTFTYRVRVNARSGPSENDSVLGGVSIGRTMEVTNTAMEGDRLWVYGTVTLDNGSTVEAWTIASGLNTTPQ